MPDTTPARPRRAWTTLADGPRLRELRRQHGLTQHALARQAGISAATITRLETQPTATCRGRTLARLAAALGAEPAAVIATPRPPAQRRPQDSQPAP